jgi:hypothetical protein
MRDIAITSKENNEIFFFTCTPPDLDEIPFHTLKKRFHFAEFATIAYLHHTPCLFSANIQQALTLP